MHTILLDKYGLFMTVEELAETVRANKQTIYNRLYNDTLEIPHWRDGKRYLFPTISVSDYISAKLENP